MSLVVSSRTVRSMQYYRARLRCENLNLEVAKLDFDSFGKRVGLNQLTEFPTTHHPNLTRAKSFKFADKHFDKLDMKTDDQRDFWWITEQDTLEEMVGILLEKTVIAIDTEIDCEYSYLPIISIIQISCDNYDFVIDAIKLHAYISNNLRPIFLSKDILKIIYSPHDLHAFKRDFNLYFCYVIDFQHIWSSKNNFKENISFDATIDQTLNIKISKKNQTFHFRLRDLPKDVLNYCRDDSKLLLFAWERVKDQLKDFLIEKYDYLYLDRFICRPYAFPKDTAVSSQFNRIRSKLRGEQQFSFSPDKYLNIFASIVNWRKRAAQTRDLPPRKILYPLEMVRLCVEKPKTIKLLEDMISRIKFWHEECKQSLIDVILGSHENVYNENVPTSSKKVTKITFCFSSSEDSDDESIIVQAGKKQKTEHASVALKENDDAMSIASDLQVTVENDLFDIDAIYEDAEKESEKEKSLNQSSSDLGIANMTVSDVESSENFTDSSLCESVESVNPVENDRDEKKFVINDFYDVSDFDLMNNWDKIRNDNQEAEKKQLINRLRRKRQCMKQININKNRVENGEEKIMFTRYKKWL